MKIIILKSVEKFILKLDEHSRLRIYREIEILGELNYLLSMPESKKIGPNLHELRILGKIQIRIFYTFHNNEIYLLHAIVKKSQKIPKKDLELVKRRFKLLT
ncbi:MAG TPA: type II toxin-antitoxin system RelE/ParE family toxin [Candidatus Doudnabacteria bacterium]|nr:type II toxin-antitoxin system RelE/ParE family toxin [Candidatus Doudnabacteria bacterium]